MCEHSYMDSQPLIDFKKYKNYEKTLSAMIVFIAVLSPVIFASLLDNNLQIIYLMVLGGMLVSFTVGLIYVRSLISERLNNQYLSLDVGSTLRKKISSNSTTFVIINKTFHHFYLQDQKGLRILVPKNRIQEDFDIAN